MLVAPEKEASIPETQMNEDHKKARIIASCNLVFDPLKGVHEYGMLSDKSEHRKLSLQKPSAPEILSLT